jgi:5-methylcytosine-specific restriction endonuclease McrA
MSHVFVLSWEKRPLDPTHPGYARWLLTQRRAVVFRRYPFTILLREQQPDLPTHPLRLKIDPGSKTTGLALVNHASETVGWAAELTYRGHQVNKHLADRHAVRRLRRQRKTRYRPARGLNRRRKPGWLPPSLESRIANILMWVARLRRLCPIGALSQELVKFDTQLMEHLEITGVEYQHGTLAGYELREYLLEKWGRRCAYCNKFGMPLQMEHLTPRARDGSNRVSNLTLAGEPCNVRKGTRTAAEFGFPGLQAQAKRPLNDAAAVNATRWVLYEQFIAAGLPIETGTGSRTKWNRLQLNLPKTHWLDAACVGASTPAVLQVQQVQCLAIMAAGWQCRQMCLMRDAGFPRTRARQQSGVCGCRTDDMVQAVVPTGTKAGTFVGRVAVRATGYFNVTTKTRTIQGIAARACQAIHHQDGYSYANGGATSSPSPAGEGSPSPVSL